MSNANVSCPLTTSECVQSVQKWIKGNLDAHNDLCKRESWREQVHMWRNIEILSEKTGCQKHGKFQSD